MTAETILIKKSKKGDRKAQRELYDLYRTKWMMICLRYLSNRPDALDVLQNSLIKIFGKMDQYRESAGSFSGWSGKIVVNESLMFLRKRSRFDHVTEINDNLPLEDKGETPLEKMSAEALTHLVQQLPDGYRIVFNMYAIEGYTHKEIAKNLGISEGTSKSQLFKARNLLRSKVETLLQTNMQ